MFTATSFMVLVTVVLFGGRVVHKLLDLCFGKCEE